MRATIILFLALSLAACAEEDDTAELQAGLDDLVANEVETNGFLGTGVSVRLADGRVLRSAAGHSDPAAQDAYDVGATEQVIGSVTKLYTAVLVMQLVEEGRIGLDDPADRWVSFAGADAITVRMLLTHTSGLNDYLPLMTLEQLGTPWPPARLLDLALAAGPMGSPGMEKAIYSNTNFLVLGMIVEAATGRSWEDNVAERIAAPIGLHHTFYAGEADRAAGVAGGWVQTPDGWLDTMTLFDPSVGWSVGALVATNGELREFTASLFDGELFQSPDTVAAMRSFDTEMDPAFMGEDPTSCVGLGITSMTVDGITFDGHLGHIDGYNAAALRDRDEGVIIVVTSNDDRAWAGPIALEVARYLRDR